MENSKKPAPAKELTETNFEVEEAEVIEWVNDGINELIDSFRKLYNNYYYKGF